MFQDGSIKAITPASYQLGKNLTEFLNPNHHIQLRTITRHSGATFPKPFSSSQDWCWPVKQKVHKTKSCWFHANMTDFKRFPFNNFTYCLTLFSKFFSSFPHGTCSLSVSRQYLALDGIYHPFRAAFPNNSTHWERIQKYWESMPETGLSPSMMLFSKRLVHGPTLIPLLEITTQTAWTVRFKIWALPSSLAVTKGILVSFFSSAYWYA